MERILLVDDQPQPGTHHTAVFGPLADVCTSVDQLTERLRRGDTWSAAFVDFALSDDIGGQRTGLSALRLLKQQRPETRRVVYTTLGENGRTLFAVASYRWLDTEVVIDKSAATKSVLENAADVTAANPTASGWQRRLREHALLIDYLFADANWLGIWREWWAQNGSVSAVSKQLGPPFTPHVVQQFSTQVTQHVLNFEAAFFGASAREREGRSTARATPVASFARRHDFFFQAVDLDPVLNDAAPWLTVRAKA